MRIAVCVKPSADGELGPFDAAAYESALRVEGAEVVLVSMAPRDASGLLTRLTRLGARKAILLSDAAFAGADTLATGYALSLAIRRLKPDLVFCGRQTLEGDTAQVGIGLAARLGYACVTQVLEIRSVGDARIACRTRHGDREAAYPALITVERICGLRLPSIRSTAGEVEILDAAALGADPARCGLAGSPTRVVKSFENASGRRRCTRIDPADFDRVLKACLSEKREARVVETSARKLNGLWTVGERPLTMARTVADGVKTVPPMEAEALAGKIRAENPSAVLFDSTAEGKELAAKTAVLLETGLCADCTALETDGETIFFYRPALAGNVIAKIRCNAYPPMATVRTETPGAALAFAMGLGAAGFIEDLNELAARYGAETAATRAAVDRDLFPYEKQVGLTGRTVAPETYVAFGISGAVHHLAGIRGAKRIIAVNSDPDAPIFDFADYGIVAGVGDVIDRMRNGAFPESKRK